MAAHRVWVFAGAMVIAFHLGLIFYGLVPNLIARPLHLALALPWVLVFSANSRSLYLSGLILAVVGVACCLWIAFNQGNLSDQYGFLEGRFQFVIAIVLLVVVLEAARRAIGWPLPLVAVAALAYALFGQHIAGEFGHSGTPLASFLGTMTIAEGGIWGSLSGISVNVVAIFVIFGAVLNAGEAGQGFINVASAAAGRLKGGAAKVSVISSALFGSISGSASANVASTGAVTLPAMRKLGYPKHLAAAVEAVASSGGQIMPPLMGAGAFVMVELTGIPYTGIMAAAVLPAVLYFLVVWVGINCYARHYELKGLPDDAKPSPRDVIVTSAFFAVPFACLLWGMFVAQVTPQYAACMAIVAGTVMLLIDARLTLDVDRTKQRLASTCLIAGRQVALIASIIFCASIIIGVLSVTGLGIKITSVILSASGGQLWPSLLLTALACLVLGMEVPTTAAYVICISVAGPALTQLGLEPLQAHLFVFWFALLSTITPPVCGAVFIAAGMVNENWLKVACTAMALGGGLYLIPLGMILQPQIINLSSEPLLATMAFVQLAISLSLISLGLIGYTAVRTRMIFVCAGLVILIYPAFVP